MNPKSQPDQASAAQPCPEDPAFAAAFSVDALHRAYRGLLRSHYDAFTDSPRIAAGSDRLTLRLFDLQREQHLAAASRQVLSGRYRFAAFLEREIPKDYSAETRTISVAKIRDVVVQRALYQYLYGAVDDRLTDSVFGYRVGRSAHDAVAAIQRHFAAGRVYVFDADLQKFFDSLDHPTLKHMIDGLPVDRRAARLAWRFCRAGRVLAEARESASDRTRYRVVSRVHGVPQGGVLSGLLANLYLSSMDDAVRAAGGALVRYADDFVICCGSVAECKRVRAVVTEALDPLGVVLHDGKTEECVFAQNGVRFLGFELRPGEVRIHRKNIGKFKRRIANILQLAGERGFSSSEIALRWICRRVRLKVTGPGSPHIDRMIENGLASHPHRRCWIGFFRILTDEHQVRGLDHWIRRQISTHMWRVYRVKVRLRHMQARGLASLMAQLWKARAAAPALAGGGVVDDESEIKMRRLPASREGDSMTWRAGITPRPRFRTVCRKVPTQGGGPERYALDGGGPYLTEKALNEPG